MPSEPARPLTHVTAHDLATIQHMAAELADYLLSDVAFWQMQAPSDFPRLSLGALLLTRARLEAARVQLSPGDLADLDRAERAIDSILAGRPVACEKKAEQELRSRINLWKAFLSDCAEDPRAGDNYAHEVTQRVIASLLLRQFPRLTDSSEAQRVAALDAQLRPRLRSGAFIWANDLEQAFPSNEFWFLYGRIG
jgi:hypothetical protein